MNILSIKPCFTRRIQTSFLLARIAGALSLALLVSSCATQTTVKETKEVEKEQQLEWPAPPEQARIRYIGDLSSLENLSDKEKKSFRDILMGEEDKEGNTALLKPYGVHSDSKGRVFVADTGFSGLVVFNLKNKDVSFWGVTGYGALTKPTGVTSDAMGNVYVSDTSDQRIVVFNSDGDYINAYGGKDALTNPAGMVFNDETQQLYVVDAHRHQIIVFNQQGGVDFTIGERGSEPGQFNFPTNIAIDGSGRLYVSDTMNFRIQILEADGTFVNTFGEVGDRIGNVNRLKGVGVDTEGHIYAVDASYNNFQILDNEGQLLLIVGGPGFTEPAEYSMPAGVHVDKNNHIFIVDTLNRRIQMFEYLGEPDPAETRQ
jgi:sugar lactone lactonase YvrE